LFIYLILPIFHSLSYPDHLNDKAAYTIHFVSSHFVHRSLLPSHDNAPHFRDLLFASRDITGSATCASTLTSSHDHFLLYEVSSISFSRLHHNRAAYFICTSLALLIGLTFHYPRFIVHPL
jgi:hypothetical protein